jgi:hypothetical protein
MEIFNQTCKIKGNKKLFNLTNPTQAIPWTIDN